jgi:hypothetical protein
MQVFHLSLGLHSKAPPKLHIGYLEMTLHVSIAFKVGLSFKVLPKSPMSYFEMNLNMAIAFKVRVSYNFAISTHVLTFTNSKLDLNFLNNEIKFVTKHKVRYVSYHLLISSS